MNQPNPFDPFSQQNIFNFNQLQPQQQQQQTLIPPIVNTLPIQETLHLTQSQGYIPPKSFVDSSNATWTLIKSAFDSTVDVPDHKAMQKVSWWYNEIPQQNNVKAYIYVVECIRMPRVETEQPACILYQWFSAYNVPQFSPDKITEKEWLRANVYAAPIVDTRQSKINAICYINGAPQQEEKQENLLQLDELNGRSAEHNQDQGQQGQG